MKVLGKDYDEKTLRKYSNVSESINTAKRIQFLDGKAKGTEAIEVVCSSGLELTILVDRGLDIASARYKGVNIGFMSKNGITGRVDGHPDETEFVHYFAGGLLTTCGLRNAGGGCRDENGEYHPTHGRINTIAAQDVAIVWKDRETVEISGSMKETSLFGCSLKLRRTITVHTSEARICINDELENETAEPEEFMILYHTNFGFPFLQEGCKLEFEPQDQVTPLTDEAMKGIGDHTNINAPTDGRPEQCFYHIQKGDEEKKGHVRLINKALSLAADLRYSLDTLPVLVQWKAMKSNDYALGLEPSNSYIKGRVAERKNGTLKTILPYSTQQFTVELKISDL